MKLQSLNLGFPFIYRIILIIMKEKEKSSLVDLGKRLLEASRKGQADEVSMLMASGAPFTTDWVWHC